MVLKIKGKLGDENLFYIYSHKMNQKFECWKKEPKYNHKSQKIEH